MFHEVFVAVLTCGFLVSLSLYYSYLKESLHDKNIGGHVPYSNKWQHVSKRERPLFLWWTLFHRRNDLHLLKPLVNCTFQCDFTGNKSSLKEANVVVFHGCDMNKEDLPQTEPWQVKLFLMLESPGRRNHFYNYWNDIPMNYFNATSTYKKESDYYLPYMTLPKMSSTMPSYTGEEIEAAVNKKKNGSFSLISHCWAGSNRDGIIKKISEFTPVTRYGKCGASCNKECELKAIETFHFFFAFENTICDEYVTEKFGRFKRLIVPVTMKRSDVPDFVPADAFIAVDDFCSIEDLADHLNYLMKNKTAYKSYFNWAKSHSYAKGEATMCKLCEDLYMDRVKTQDYSQFPSIAKYFSAEQCDFSFGRKLIADRCEMPTSSRSPKIE